MKHTVRSGVSLLLCLLMLLCFAGCGNSAQAGDLWQSATYTQDKEFGSGAKTVSVEVKAGERSVTFTVKTDADTLGAALLEHKLIDGVQGDYGLNVTVVNGMTADYSKDKSYWGFYKDGTMMMVGVDGANIADGEHYELVYTK